MNKNFAETDDPKDKNDPAGEETTNWQEITQRNQAISTCYDWFVKDRQAKEPYTNEMDEMYKLYKGDHWDLLDSSSRVLRTDAQKENHPNAVENIVFSLVEGLVAEFSEPKELIDYPTEAGDDEMARTMTELKEYIGYKNRHNAELIKWLRWFFLYGSGIWSKTWDPNWKGGKGPNRWSGDIRWVAKHPRSIFPDARCLDNVEDGRRVHDASYRTIEEVEEIWPNIKGITPDSLNDDVIISEELEDSNVEATEDQVLVVDTWYKGSPMILGEGEQDEGPGLHLIQWAGEGSLRYLSHANYIYFEPGEDCTFPIQVLKCYERERSPWGMGEAYMLKNPQIILNKTAELIIESHIHEALGQTWYESNAVTEKQQKVIQDKGTLGGMWFQVENVDGIHREFSKGVPASLENEMGRINKTMEAIIGRYDISQGKTPGSVTAFQALNLLAQRAQVRLKSKEMTINAGMEDSGNYINRLVARFYTDKRKYRILGKDDSKPKYGEYDGESMKKAYFFDDNETIPYQDLQVLTEGQEVLPPEEQLIEGRDYEVYSPEFDTKCRTTTELPSDRVFYMDMAKELFLSQLIDPEEFYYVLEFGKFPPVEDILAKIKKRREAAAKPEQQTTEPKMPSISISFNDIPPILNEAQAQILALAGVQVNPASVMSTAGGQTQPQGQQVPPETKQQVQQFINYLKDNDLATLQQIAQLPQDQQLPEIMRLMRQQGQQPVETGQPPEQTIPASTDTGTEIPPEADGAAIKQQLLDILATQDETQIPQQ